MIAALGLGIDGADGLEQLPGAVAIDAVAEIEILFRFTRHNRRQMEDHIGMACHQLFGFAGQRVIRGDRGAGERAIGGCGGFHHIMQSGFADGLAVDLAMLGQTFGQLAANHACRADNKNVHCLELLRDKNQSAKPPSARWIWPVV